MSRVIRIGTRKSALAVVQAQMVAEAMKKASPELEFELVKKQTAGDRILDKPLLEFGGKGVFVSEFEQALLDGEIDFAVHSAKDLPMELADGLAIVGVPGREDPRDVLITMKGTILQAGKEISIGTSSLRRRLQIERLGNSLWPGSVITCGNLRGNVQTRLDKLKQGDYDAVILAAAGLKRLGLDQSEKYHFHYFECEAFIPAGGQGILAVEGRAGDPVNEAAYRIHDEAAGSCLMAERKVLHYLEAGCHEPVGVYSAIKDGLLEIRGICQREACSNEVHVIGPLEEMDSLVQAAGTRLAERNG